MKDNKQILNEAFFKKASYAEKRDRKMAQYSPVDAKSVNIGKNFNPETGAYQVTDTDTVKKRLADTFGATFGHNSVKSMAGRAVKSFPIIVSDNVEPDTIVMLKKLMEEQYAEYINLLVSNQVVDLSNYRSNGEDGNIAIQALDTLSGAEFGTAKLSDKVSRTGNIDPDTLFSNIATYQLLRENNQIYTSGDTITDSLLEGALIVTPDKVKDAASAILEWNPPGGPTYSVKYRGNEIDDYLDDKYEYDNDDYSGTSRNIKDVRLSKYLMDLEDEEESTKADTQYKNALNRDKRS